MIGIFAGGLNLYDTLIILINYELANIFHQISMKILRNILLSLLLLQLCSCVSTKTAQYVQGRFDTTRLSKYLVSDPVIQKGDLISITVYSDNPLATALYNLPNVAGSNSAGASNATSGYMVDEKGFIQFQGIGNLQVAGLTKPKLTELLNSQLSEFLKNPYYIIRFLNYRITLIGELNREGVYTIPNERVNIFEAIGLAGGLNIYARRESVVVIRETNGKREFARLDLTNPDVFNSPYYFLQQNDMVLVEQTKSKAAINDQTTARNISLATGVISTLVFIYTVFR